MHCTLVEVFYFQMVKLFMFSPVSGLYSCPLAMTDGAAKTIQVNILKYVNLNFPTFIPCSHSVYPYPGLTTI